MTELRRDGKCGRMLMGDGGYFDFVHPETSSVTIEDVAWSLACTGRFRGQTRSTRTGKRVFYSVAEHCVRGANALFGDDPTIISLVRNTTRITTMKGLASLARSFLFHELGEVPVGDHATPFKMVFPEIRVREKAYDRALIDLLDIQMVYPDTIKHLDNVMYWTERRDLQPHATTPPPEGTRTLEDIIRPMSPEQAAADFMHMERLIQITLSQPDRQLEDLISA